MTTFMHHDDAIRSPEMRHEIAEPVMDPVTFIEHDGRRIVVGSVLEEPIFATREDVVDEFMNIHHLGVDELVKDQSVPQTHIKPELVLRALARLGIGEVVVPASFHVFVADYLRDRGIKIVADPDAWAMRRRHKAPWELEGMERAQRAAETAFLTAARMLRSAEPTSAGRLRFEGEILTAELVREAMAAELISQGAESEEVLVHSGDACLNAHEPGTGPILPDQSCIIDCFPRDRRTGTYTDMTRTFVPGVPSEELARLHADCVDALKIAFAALQPGTKNAHQEVSEFFHSKGYPTATHHSGDDPLIEGAPYALGHGVGLEVHENPWMGRRSEELIVGDVVAVEPGLYFGGVGGVRLEDTVLITDDGIEHFTDPFPYDLGP